MDFNTLVFDAIHFVIQENLVLPFLDALDAVSEDADTVVHLLERIVSGAPYLEEYLIDLASPNDADVQFTQDQAFSIMGLDPLGNIQVSHNVETLGFSGAFHGAATLDYIIPQDYDSEDYTDGLLSNVSLQLDSVSESDSYDNTSWLEEESSWDLDPLFSGTVGNLDWLEQESSWDLDKLFD